MLNSVLRSFFFTFLPEEVDSNSCYNCYNERMGEHESMEVEKNGNEKSTM